MLLSVCPLLLALGLVQQSNRYGRNRHSLILWALTLTLSLKMANQFLHIMLWFTRMHRCAKFGHKRISSSDLFWFNISPHCDCDLEDSKPVFWHYTHARDDASPYQVWLQKVQQSRWTFTDIFYLRCKPIFSHDTLAHDDASPCQVWLHMVQQVRDIVQTNIYWNVESSLPPLLWMLQFNLFTRHSSL